MAFERNMLDGYQRISNSIIIGESPNLGSGQWIKVQNHKKDNVNILNTKYELCENILIIVE